MRRDRTRSRLRGRSVVAASPSAELRGLFGLMTALRFRFCRRAARASFACFSLVAGGSLHLPGCRSGRVHSACRVHWPRVLLASQTLFVV